MKKYISILATILFMLSNFPSTIVNAQTKDASNPLLQKWNTPFEIPPFEKVKPEHYIPAYKYAMAEHIKEINTIIENKKPATFENTIIAYDNA